MGKICPTCKITKAREEFSNDKCSKDGLQTYCKSCSRDRRKARKAGIVCKYCPRQASFTTIPACYTHGLQIRKGLEPGHIEPRRSRKDTIRDDEILCIVCDTWKNKSEYKFRDEKGFYVSACRHCDNLRKRASRFKMPLEEVRRISSSSCEACGSTEKLCIDHYHSCCPGEGMTCGECFRGVLCGPCNTSLGLLKDDPDRIKGLLKYVESRTKTLT